MQSAIGCIYGHLYHLITLVILACMYVYVYVRVYTPAHIYALMYTYMPVCVSTRRINDSIPPFKDMFY